ncbi:b(0,+)-type amino acid transporter 1 [Cryptotermes secundus]|uniref:b(0,+)-type amino acid transporter 1 n=2 Tax=Cryptotermes secundus TaxID=105785 RepID=A0A2J7QMN0_9NEOP|nr:b(0,+)-type amino acid transporter 1 isoform X1 [Cryptotermes secundus]XP_023711382.1 b(0,+)-type amino acid transporter 1 isoform X1 [Cryptotermes secundus]XP_023711383.1 b(0,+)-type amino acid transporter 1 isoform X1 [Cryptotermes secundus]XP_023711384.1 b(0,+)-type amino acid transporter 1 isoform X1 [Cryptotermes secundus]PNF29854.1 b(0,+)-type amino acid transporter 1 [Cryptotermes secundus]PNF29855.1 b(0,+)-type amino acid transporter 1 [Cryptotermes secundus]
MVAATPSEFGLHNREVKLPGGSVEPFPGQSTESLPTRSTEMLNKVELKRELGLFSAVNLNVGCMIGSGIFISPSIALERAGSVGLCLVIWAVCGAISLMGALTFVELSSVVPRSGAEYSYFLEAFGSLHKFWGPLPSFVCAFINVCILNPTSTAVIILTFSEYVCHPFAHQMSGMTPESQDMVKKMIAIVGLGLMTVINFMSVKLYVRMQNIFSVCKLVVCGIVILTGVVLLCTGETENLSKGSEGSAASPENLALAFYGCLWSYGGWSTITVITEEVKKPEVNVLRSIVITLPLVTAVYLMMNVAYMTILTIPEMVTASAVAVVFGDRMLGVMNFIIPVGVAISTFGCALNNQFATARLCYVAGREGHMVEAFSYIHMRRLTPAPAVLLQGLLAFLFIISGDIKSLIDFCSFLVWIFYGFAMVALMVMRKTKKDASRHYKVPVFIPVLVILVALFLCLVPIITDPTPKYFLALLFIGLGMILYVPLVYHKFRPKWMNEFTYFIQVLLEVVPPENELE